MALSRGEVRKRMESVVYAPTARKFFDVGPDGRYVINDAGLLRAALALGLTEDELRDAWMGTPDAFERALKGARTPAVRLSLAPLASDPNADRAGATHQGSAEQ